jgi:hypothetical protein
MIARLVEGGLKFFAEFGEPFEALLVCQVLVDTAFERHVSDPHPLVIALIIY